MVSAEKTVKNERDDAIRGAISASEYPFSSNYFEVNGAHRMHYVDEGEGKPVVMIHGNPSWSFYYRNLIQRLRSDVRTIAPDHIGCGLSDKPGDEDYEYTLSRRVADLDAFLSEVVAGEKVTLVLHDWGGMIGMAWAVRNPERVERIVLLNTAAFHLPDSKRLPLSLWLARNTRVGAFLVNRFNAFSRGAVRFCVTEKMSDEVAQSYTAPYSSPKDRIATLRFVQDIPLKPGDLGYELVSETEAKLPSLSDRPILIGWGHQDFVFDAHFLDRWRQIYPDAQYVEYPDAGHYVLEDRSEELGAEIATFLNATDDG